MKTVKTWMKAHRYAALVPVLVGALGVLSPAQETAPQGARSKPAPAVRELIDKLGDPSYEARQEAEKRLRRMGSRAQEALREAAKSHQDPEVRYRAERILRALEHDQTEEHGELRPRGEAGRPRGRLPGGWLDGDLGDMFESLFERLEREFGIDIPRQRFFHDEFFNDIRRQMEELRERMRRLGAQGAPGATSEARSFELRAAPDGVRLKIEEKGPDGKVRSRTYEAPDLDTFREKYPEVARRFLDRHDGGLVFRFDPEKFFGRVLRGVWPRPGGAAAPDRRPSRHARGARLGVLARPIGEDLRAFLGIEEGQGLLVEEVQPETLAARLGIRPHDVILEIDGRPIGSPADVRTALAEAKDEVRVVVNRRGRVTTLKASKKPSKSS